MFYDLIWECFQKIIDFVDGCCHGCVNVCFCCILTVGSRNCSRVRKDCDGEEQRLVCFTDVAYAEMENHEQTN